MPEQVRARAFWSGTISFGLVSIPVNLFAASRPRGVSLRMLSPAGTPLVRRFYNPETGREISRDSIVRGYEVEKDEYVVVTDEELERVAPEKTRDIDLRVFVDRDEIDPIYFERAYFLAPAGNSAKAYRLLAATMEESNRAGIATFVMRTKEYLVAILSDEGILRAETLRFHDEIRDVEAIGLPDTPKVPSATVTAMAKQIRKLARASLDEDELQDDYAERLVKLVERKRKAGDDVVETAAVAEEEEGVEVIDLMEVLKRSLQGQEPAPGPRRSKRGGGGAGRGEELDELSKAALYERAQELDIPGRSGMTKAELIRAIRKSA